jgi:integrase
VVDKKEKLTIDNPWADVRVAVPPKQKPKLFSKKEITLILEGFETHPTHNHYHDFVV